MFKTQSNILQSKLKSSLVFTRSVNTAEVYVVFPVRPNKVPLFRLWSAPAPGKQINRASKDLLLFNAHTQNCSMHTHKTVQCTHTKLFTLCNHGDCTYGKLYLGSPILVN